MWSPAPIPSFALVGQPNEGKSTVLATFAEKDGIPIDPRPGTTRKCDRYPVMIDGEEVFVLSDTPGFEHPAEVLQWVAANSTDARLFPTSLIGFLQERDFEPEHEIIKPLSEGAVALLVVDASRPVRQVDTQVAQLLSLLGVPRIAIINSKEGDGEFLKDWETMFRTESIQVHKFNGHGATFKHRMELLKVLREALPQWRGGLDRAMKALKQNRAIRLSDAVDEILTTLKKTLELRKRVDVQDPADEKAREEARKLLMDAVREEETHFRRKIRRIFNHCRDHWGFEKEIELDLFDKEVWRLIGLTRGQLIVRAAAAGAVVGGSIDAGTGGTSFMLGTLIGCGSGAVMAWLVPSDAVSISFPGVGVGSLRLSRMSLGCRYIEAAVSPASNLVWIYVDRLLLYIRACMLWAHGKRSEDPVQPDQNGIPLTTTWSSADRKKITRFMNALQSGNQNKQEKTRRELRELLYRLLADLDPE